MTQYRRRPVDEDEPVRCYHPPCNRCGRRHTPFQPCFDEHMKESAGAHMLGLWIPAVGITLILIVASILTHCIK